MAQEWNIRPRATHCSACSTVFAEGQPYLTRLTFESTDYTRGDYCESCWASVSSQHPGYSSWKGVFRLPPQEPDRRVRKETAERLLRRLMEDNDPSRKNAIYIIAVMLERQRVFQERETHKTEDGRRVIVYEHKRTGETFAVIDPQLRLEEVEPVQQEIMALLTGEETQPVMTEEPAGRTPPPTDV